MTPHESLKNFTTYKDSIAQVFIKSMNFQFNYFATYFSAKFICRHMVFFSNFDVSVEYGLLAQV